MSRQALVAGCIALLIVAGAVSAILYSTRNVALRLQGEVLKVRSHQIENERTIALVDVRLTNPSDQQLVVKEVTVDVEQSDGRSVLADLFTEEEIARVLAYYPVLGRKDNQGLIRRDKINPRQTVSTLR